MSEDSTTQGLCNATGLPVEVELKLAFPASKARQIWQLPPLAALLDKAPSRSRLYSAYFDTPTLELYQRGIALRLRRRGRQWVQTLKTGADTGSVLQRRVELEAPASSGIPDPRWLVRCPLPELAGWDAERGNLGVVFTTDFQRTSAVIEPAPGTSVEVSVDVGSVAAGRRNEQTNEVELELKQGDLAHLFDLAADLAALPGIRVESVSKAQRGYRLVNRERPSPRKASRVDLVSRDSVDQLFVKLAFACIAQLQANENGLLHSRDIEYLHQARVALRRLRSVFSVFSGAIPRAHFSDHLIWLRQTAQTLGQARNWDVFLNEFLPEAGQDLVNDPAYRSLTRAAGRLRSESRRQARDTFSSPAYSTGILRLTQSLLEQDWISEQTPEQRKLAALRAKKFARKVISRSHRKLTKQGKQLDRTNYRDIHRLRIRIKKQRYAAELLAPLFDGAAHRKYSSRLGNLQDVLGTFNDAANADSMLQQLGNNGNADRRVIAAYLRGYANACSRESISHFDAAWRRFLKTEPFW